MLKSKVNVYLQPIIRGGIRMYTIIKKNLSDAHLL